MNRENNSSSQGAAPDSSAQNSAGWEPFPVPDFDDSTLAFGPSGGAYLTRDQLGDFYDLNNRTPWHRAASGLFFSGGKLADYGLEFKPGIDRAKAHRAIQALLRSFAPKHEIKIGTVAYALRDWCGDPKPADAKAEGRPQ